MFTDNDELAGLMAMMLEADALILLSNIDGIFDGDPDATGSKVIREIVADAEDLSGVIQSDRKSSFGRGGMQTKYRIAREVAGTGIEVMIANGRRNDILLSLTTGIKGTVCTRFVASPKDRKQRR
jgi:glutamate 5-kinase